MRDLKLLFLHDHVFYQDNHGQYYSGGGLPASVWSRYLKHFSSLTVTGRRSPKPLAADEVDGFALSSASNVAFHLIENISGIRSRFNNIRIARKEIKALVQSHDAVIARLTSEFGLIAISEARKQGKPWAVELVDCPWDALWSYGTITAKVYAPILWWRIRSAMAKSTHALYVTKEFLQTRYPCGNAITVDCSNVEIPSLSQDVLKARLKRIETLGERKLVFGLLGSLHGRFKGIHIAMQALAEMRQTLPPFEFRVLGGGDPSPWRAEAERLGLSDVVFLDGVLPSGQPVYDWLDKVDIYLHPSFKEGLPRALIEAMSRGCPAIATSVAGTPELLPPEFLVQPGDSRQLAIKISSLSSSVKLMIEAAKHNFSTADNYVVDKLNKKRDEFWQSFAKYVKDKHEQ